MIHETWGKRLKQVFSDLPDPTWTGPQVVSEQPPTNSQQIHEPVRASMPVRLNLQDPDVGPRTIQSLADDHGLGQSQLF
jgi:hypothetical protein